MRPMVAERVGDHAVAVSPELVCQLGHYGGARVERPLELGVDVVDRQMDGDRGSAQRLSASSTCRHTSPGNRR